MTYEQTKSHLYNYRTLLLEIAELERTRQHLLQQLSDVPSCVAKYGGRIPQGDAPSIPERVAEKNDKLLDRYHQVCNEIERKQKIVSDIDYAFQSCLTQTQREVCHLKFIDRMSFADIASQTNREPPAVAKIISRSIRRIAEVMEAPF